MLTPQRGSVPSALKTKHLVRSKAPGQILNRVLKMLQRQEYCDGSCNVFLLKVLKLSQKIQTHSRLLRIMFVVVLHSSLTTTLSVCPEHAQKMRKWASRLRMLPKHADTTAGNRGDSHKLCSKLCS